MIIVFAHKKSLLGFIFYSEGFRDRTPLDKYSNIKKEKGNCPYQLIVIC